MKKTAKIILLLSLIIITQRLTAQQDAMFTHYMYNTLAVNPGYAGSRDALTVTALHRSQWVGFAGAPMTQTLTLHTPVKRDNIGLGFSFVNDRIGPLNNSSLYADFAYRIKLNEKSKLSIGIKGGVNMIRAKLNQLNLDQANDNSFQVSDFLFAPNFGAGIYYSHERFYLGLSVPRLLENSYKAGASSSSIAIKERRHYFFIAGAVFRLSKNLELKPTTLVKMTVGAPIEADFTANFILNKNLHLGAMYRTGDAFGALLGYNITEQLFLSYSFDWSYGLKTITYHGGSHELMLRYDFVYNVKQKIRSPRYF
jgi:type IX secretion system PorP/SprF family membrane protein